MSQKPQKGVFGAKLRFQSPATVAAAASINKNKSMELYMKKA
jgi:hypothetical protein